MSLANRKKLLLVINPVSGKGVGKSKLFEVVDIFSSNGFRVTVMPTKHGETEKMVCEEAKNYDLLVAIGGDGTLNSVVNGIMNSKTEIPLGYIPLGSTNDFGKSLELPTNIKDACKAIIKGRTRKIDLGKFGDKYFVYVAYSGMFAETSYNTPQQLKNTLGHSAYIWSALATLPKEKKEKYNVFLDDEIIDGDYLLVAVSNTLRVGGVIQLSKDVVDFDDGYFELTLVKAPDNTIGWAYLANDIMLSQLGTSNFISRKVKKVKIRFENPKGWSLDGEFGGQHKEIDIQICEKALNLIY